MVRPPARPMSRRTPGWRARGSACIRTTLDRMSAPIPCTTSASGPARTAAAIRVWSRARDLDRARGLRRRRPRLGRRAHAARARRARRLERHLRGARPGRALRRCGSTGPAGVDHAFDPGAHLLDPYARGLVARRPTARGAASCWSRSPTPVRLGRPSKPRVALDHTVVYEAHVRGFSKLNRAIPEELRGTYAGLAHDASLEYLTDLGVTTVELLPVHAFVTEQRLVGRGASTTGATTRSPSSRRTRRTRRRPRSPRAPAPCCASSRAWCGGCTRPASRWCSTSSTTTPPRRAVGGPTYSFRGIDNAAYYRHDAHGRYVDTTGCGNTLDFGRGGAAAARARLPALLRRRAAGRRVPPRPRRHARPRRPRRLHARSIRCCARCSTTRC